MPMQSTLVDYMGIVFCFSWCIYVNMELEVKFLIADTLEFYIVIFCEHS